MTTRRMLVYCPSDIDKSVEKHAGGYLIGWKKSQIDESNGEPVYVAGVVPYSYGLDPLKAVLATYDPPAMVLGEWRTKNDTATTTGSTAATPDTPWYLIMTRINHQSPPSVFAVVSSLDEQDRPVSPPPRFSLVLFDRPTTAFHFYPPSSPRWQLLNHTTALQRHVFMLQSPGSAGELAATVGWRRFIIRSIRSLFHHPIPWLVSLVHVSLIVRLLEKRVEEILEWPSRVYHLRQQQKMAKQIDLVGSRVGALLSFGFILLLDLGLGYYVSHHGIPVGGWMATTTIVSDTMRQVRSHVEWLMGAPAGFKLNPPLTTILGNGILMVVDVWQFLMDAVGRWAAANALLWPAVLSCCRLIGSFGLTFQLAFVSDLVQFVSCHTYLMYMYFARLYHFQLNLLSSLSNLFLGRKKNVLRCRIDSCQYDIPQLLIGTLLFTIAFFLVATNTIFYLYFVLVRCACAVLQGLIRAPIGLINGCPIGDLLLYLWDATHYPNGVYLKTTHPSSSSSHTTTTTVCIQVLPIHRLFHRYVHFLRLLCFDLYHPVRVIQSVLTGDSSRLPSADVITQDLVCVYLPL